MGFFHQNVHTLQKQFQLTATEAREIVESCDDCHALGAPLPAEVNPRGLKALELWQTGVTPRSPSLAGSTVHHIGVCELMDRAAWVCCRVVPEPGRYTSAEVTSGAENPGVALDIGSRLDVLIVPRVLYHQEEEMYHFLEETILLRKREVITGFGRCATASSEGTGLNLVTKQWEGPYDLIAMGCGYACVSTDTGHAGYLQSVSILTCDHRGRIRQQQVEAVINLKATSG
ncbi:hypothetical protein DUI87_22242 [Hirundo rustica rustica]|uniref:Integrase-type domain-containing protein n=1 Tax=Hirundo rustica rustica TaxID=333673 RepID=A0A3M0JLH5_HIRRU|nr:hypothetical protein DUI87_22242 [Hirundo rustica rustica]